MKKTSKEIVTCDVCGGEIKLIFTYEDFWYNLNYFLGCFSRGFVGYTGYLHSSLDICKKCFTEIAIYVKEKNKKSAEQVSCEKGDVK